MMDLSTHIDLRDPDIDKSTEKTNSGKARTRRSSAKVLSVAFALLFISLNVGLGLVLDYGPAEYRDPEYGLRLQSLRKRIQEHPYRPLTLVIGSSRTAMGIRPDCIESGVGPLVFNMSLAGAGPVTQLIILRRLQHEGITPEHIYLEYWPPFYRGDGAYREDGRLNPTRLRPEDCTTVNEYFSNPKGTIQMREYSFWLPFLAHRKSFLDRYTPGWLPHTERADAMFSNLDSWGWLPGRKETSAAEREQGWPNVFNFYWPLYRFYSIDQNQDAALRACLLHCKQQGISSKLLFMPESKKFQSLQTADSLAQTRRHLLVVQSSTGTPLIDARDWIQDDDSLPDGFHLSQGAAHSLMKKLKPHFYSKPDKK